MQFAFSAISASSAFQIVSNESTSRFRAVKDCFRLATGAGGAVVEDLADSLGGGGQLGALRPWFGEEAFGGVGQGLFHLAIAESAAAIKGGHRFALGISRHK